MKETGKVDHKLVLDELAEQGLSFQLLVLQFYC